MIDKQLLDAIHHSQAQIETRWRRAENENASARYEIARMKEAMLHLLTAHEPVHALGLDRDKLRILFSYVTHADKDRLKREVASHD